MKRGPGATGAARLGDANEDDATASALDPPLPRPAPSRQQQAGIERFLERRGQTDAAGGVGGEAGRLAVQAEAAGAHGVSPQEPMHWWEIDLERPADHAAITGCTRSLNATMQLAHRPLGGPWRPRRAALQLSAFGARRQAFCVAAAGADAALTAGLPPRQTCTHTLTANAGGELLLAATWDGLSILSVADLRRAACDLDRFGTARPSRIRELAGVGPTLLQPTTHAVRPSTKLAKCAWCPDVPELLASGGSGGGWLHYCRPTGAVDSWPLPCSPGVAGWTGLAAVAWLPDRRRALVGSSASNGVLLWDSGGGGGRSGTVSLESKKLGRADCLAALPGGNLVLGGCGNGRLVVWDLRMASSSVRSFGAASKAVLHQVDVARRVAQYYSNASAAAAAGLTAAEVAAAGGAAAAAAGAGGGFFGSHSGGAAAGVAGAGSVAGAFRLASAAWPGSSGSGSAAAAALGGGGGCFFSQLLPCPSDPRLLAFVQTNMQVGLLDCASGEVLHHTSTLTPAAPTQLSQWDSQYESLLSAGGPAGRERGTALGFGRPSDFRPACCQSSWDRDGSVLYTAGALWGEASATGSISSIGGSGGIGGGIGGGGGPAVATVLGPGGVVLETTASGAVVDDAPATRQVPTLAAVRLHGRPPRGPAFGGSEGSGGRGEEDGYLSGAVRHIPISHHASAVFQDRGSGALLLGTGTPLLLHIN